MQLSKRKISRIIYLSVHREELESMKKYQLLDELREYGVSVDPNSDIDADTLKEFMRSVIKRVLSKYL